jgi:hypothetical protein
MGTFKEDLKQSQNIVGDARLDDEDEADERG